MLVNPTLLMPQALRKYPETRATTCSLLITGEGEVILAVVDLLVETSLLTYPLTCQHTLSISFDWTS